MAEKKKDEKTLLQFAPEQTSPILEINNGAYARKFEAKEQPFEVEPIEEAPFLLRTGYFVVAPRAKAQGAKSATKDQPQTK